MYMVFQTGMEQPFAFIHIMEEMIQRFYLYQNQDAYYMRPLHSNERVWTMLIRRAEHFKSGHFTRRYKAAV